VHVARERPQQHLLRHLGDRPHVGQLTLLTLAACAGDDAGDGHADDRHEPDGPAPAMEDAVEYGEHEAEAERDRADERGGDRAARHRRERGPQRQDGQEPLGRPFDEVDGHDDGHHEEGQRAEKVTVGSRLRAVHRHDQLPSS
jgi:hypothetical protein